MHFKCHTSSLRQSQLFIVYIIIYEFQRQRHIGGEKKRKTGEKGEKW